MAKQPDPTTPPGAAPQGGEAANGAAPTLKVLAQYIKDFSFENPNAPHSLTQRDKGPNININVNVNANPLNENDYDVNLSINAEAKDGDTVVFNAELIYGGLFRLRNIPKHLLQPVLFVDCPTLLFPFVRRMLADLVRDGGFPPLLLDPIDFASLYTKNQGSGLAEAGENTPAN